MQFNKLVVITVGISMLAMALNGGDAFPSKRFGEYYDK
jgi:hypothetical protein